MRIDCGCENRKDIMFRATEWGLWEGLALAGYALLITTIIWKVRT